VSYLTSRHLIPMNLMFLMNPMNPTSLMNLTNRNYLRIRCFRLSQKCH